MSNAITEYLKKTAPEEVDAGFLATLASLTKVAEVSPEVVKSVVKELRDQRSNLKLIASENYCSLATQLAMGNLLTDKYAEGFPHHRFYAGCDNIDDLESYACEEACKLFGADHAYVQAHSGADANMIAYWAILSARVQAPILEELGQQNPAKLNREDWNKVRAATGSQKLLGLDYYSGGHLTHGYRFNVSAQMFDAYNYTVSEETGLLDYDQLEEQVKEVQPLIFLAGYSAYPRKINFRRMREIADKVGAVFMVDMAHFAGLVAGGVFEGDYDPVEHAHIVTATTHKTLRGPRGGLILCKEEFADYVDKGCPMVIGGPLPHVIGAKAVAFHEARKESFKDYARQVVENSRAIAAACEDLGLTVATGGTDNHLLLIDVRPQGITGRQAESALRECGITLNRNALPFDTNGPWYTSGLRIGSPAVTTLGMGTEEMKEIAAIHHLVLTNMEPATVEKGKNAGKPSRARYEIKDGIIEEARGRVKALLDQYPLYPELDLQALESIC